mgnify:CR=1 FL=1
MKKTLTVAQVQMPVTRDKSENIAAACRLIRRAARQGAELAMLPEMFCCPYENRAFRPYGEPLGGPAQLFPPLQGNWEYGSSPVPFLSWRESGYITPPLFMTIPAAR